MIKKVPCSKNPCTNDATCLNFLNGLTYTYKCACNDGYSGLNCEIGQKYKKIKIKIFVSKRTTYFN